MYIVYLLFASLLPCLPLLPPAGAPYRARGDVTTGAGVVWGRTGRVTEGSWRTLEDNLYV